MYVGDLRKKRNVYTHTHVPKYVCTYVCTYDCYPYPSTSATQQAQKILQIASKSHKQRVEVLTWGPVFMCSTKCVLL